jgi:hypothetical protein
VSHEPNPKPPQLGLAPLLQTNGAFVCKRIIFLRRL